MNKSFYTRLRDLFAHPAFIAGYSLIALGAAALANWLWSLMPASYLLGGFMIALAVIIFGIVATVLINRTKHQGEFEDKVKDLSNIIVASNMGWLVNDNYIAALERESDEIWVFTRVLNKTIQADHVVSQTQKANLEQGKKYRYFMPRNSAAISSISAYQRLFSYKDGQVLFYLVPEDEFFLYTDVVIFNVNTQRMRAVEWLPVIDKDFHIEMDEHHASIVIAAGEFIAQKHTPLKKDNYGSSGSVL